MNEPGSAPCPLTPITMHTVSSHRSQWYIHAYHHPYHITFDTALCYALCVLLKQARTLTYTYLFRLVVFDFVIASLWRHGSHMLLVRVLAGTASGRSGAGTGW